MERKRKISEPKDVFEEVAVSSHPKKKTKVQVSRRPKSKSFVLESETDRELLIKEILQIQLGPFIQQDIQEAI